MLEIKQINKEGIALIQDIAYRTWPDTFGEILSQTQIEYMLDMMYSDSALIKQMEPYRHVFLVAFYENIPLGFISYELNYKKEAVTKIHKIYLLPESQGKGIGAALMNRVQEIGKVNQQKALTLNVNKYNKAVRFYEKLGYKIIKHEDIDIGNGFLMEDAVLMKKII